MIEIYADTAYWVALQLPDDEHHQKVVEAVKLLPDGIRIVTSELVMVEFLNHLSRAGHATRQTAILNWKKIQESPEIIYVSSGHDLIEKARQKYLDVTDKSWSLTDCSSFVIMQERRISSALTTDRHFEQAGFRALMRGQAR